MYPREFDIKDSCRPTAIAWRLRERWLLLARAPSSREASPGLLLRHVKSGCQMKSQQQQPT